MLKLTTSITVLEYVNAEIFYCYWLTLGQKVTRHYWFSQIKQQAY